MSDSEVIRLKTVAFTFGFETLPHRVVCVTSLFLSVSPHSSCLCRLTLLVCVTSLLSVTSLFLSVSPHSSCLCHLTLLVCVTSLFLSVSPHSSCLSPHSSCLSHLHFTFDYTLHFTFDYTLYNLSCDK